ncbi:hypothetical protein GALMADRAFT_239835 [Galerina marginata CBS 339.88]|uniref:Cytosine-specific methyltransferase n=1 Tax=Galerina marginata (strain CBS 339.88) TaxID=685588 RepID=A0A067TP50_GALM3|nr:hypothetical protein GALMADRAFT_239835 [Galerina marginata CBS 339.88]
MSTSRLVPYVDIVIPFSHKHRRQPSQESTSSNSSNIVAELPNPDLSPRKRRRLNRATNHTDNEMASTLAQVNLERQLSPTASEFTFNPDSDTIDIDSGSQSSQSSGNNLTGLGIDTTSRRSPSLGDSSNTRTASKGKTVDCGMTYYTIENEVMEDKSLIVDGETPGDDDESDDFNAPVRVLSDFTVYKANTMELVPIAELLHMNFSAEKYGASGLVKPWIEPDEDDNDEDSQDGSTSDEDCDRVCLSAIVEFSIHNLLEDEECLDGKIYIRTEFGWYILRQPSDFYVSYFVEFWIQQRLVHLLVNACIEDARITYQDFVENLQHLDQSDNAVATATVILGRELNEDDLKAEPSMAYLLSALPDICANNKIKISRVPAVRELMGSMHDYFDDDGFSAQAYPKPRKAILHSTKKHQNKEKEVLKHRNQTFSTPVVNWIARNLFEVPLEVAKSSFDTDTDNITHIVLPHYKGHYSNPSKITWRGKQKSAGIYESVDVDGIIYDIGDIIMVEPNDIKDGSVDSLKASHTVNKYGNRCWFCQIQFFYEKPVKGRIIKMFHGLWFVHGSKTLLQETSHSKALYLLQSCDDNPITSIIKKCNVKIMRPGDEEIEDDGSPDSNDFHCGLMYDEEETVFLDIPTNALKSDPENKSQSCYACDFKADQDQLSKVNHAGPDTITVHGIDYHTFDFVYIHPSNDTMVLDIVQITKIRKLQVYVTLLGRYDDFVQYQESQGNGSDIMHDERRLFLTERTDVIPAHKIDGLCHVQLLTDETKIKEWIQEDDHYYLNQEGSKMDLHSIDKRDFSYCRNCYIEDKKVKSMHKSFLQTNSKLVGMELFSGCGGLGIGMEMSGFVDIRYAVEFSPSAAKTYMKNHPHTTMYCQDSSSLLKTARADTITNGTKKPLLSNIDHKTTCPPLPEKRDQIDFIFGGPPCQSFSRANHSKRRDDIRSTLACNMLSYVEHYEPNYFLLENVAGFLDHKFYTAHETTDGKKIESEIHCGMVKFVLRTLIALGYQVSYKLLQAGQYGAPQSRRRVIFWGAKRGISLPEFPVPVYAFPLPAYFVKLPTGGKLPPPTRSKNPIDYHNFAPLRARTVYDAISDLPPFDWENPHYIISKTNRDRKEARKRRDESCIPCFNAVAKEGDGKFKSLPGYPEGVLYPVAPHNQYQRWLRQGMDEDSKVTGQYTTRFSSKIVEATVNVPLEPLADHRSLPAILLPNHAQPHARKKDRTFYGRMDGNGYFKCAVTTLSPTLKNQWPVHPSQKRIITVREAARSQGFPDDYVFESVNNTPSLIVQDQLRQIGNAVAVPFALALGKELGKAMILEWEKKEREGSIPL